eukprot:366134-Chlamydomonas_euryale.AAC.14
MHALTPAPTHQQGTRRREFGWHALHPVAGQPGSAHHVAGQPGSAHHVVGQPGTAHHVARQPGTAHHVAGRPGSAHAKPMRLRCRAHCLSDWPPAFGAC